MNRLIPSLLSLALAAVAAASAFSANAAPRQGDTLPAFTLTSLDGKKINQKLLENAQLGVIYFFSTEKCPACLPGLEQLKQLAAEHGDDRIGIVAIAKQDIKALKAARLPTHSRIVLLAADAATLDRYNARVILPTSYVTGPGGKILNVLQGGGASSEALLMTLAEKQLARKQAPVARKIYEKAAKAGDNPLARAGIAYSLLKEGKLDEAERSFAQLAKAKDRDSALRGREGLAEVWLAKGKTEQVLKEVDAVLEVQPKRVAANLIRARALSLAGRNNDAGVALVRATDIEAVSDFSWQRSDAQIARGNLQRKADPKAAVAAYKVAVKENPHSVEALSNLGAVLQSCGDTAQALQVLQQAKLLDPADKLLHGLLRQVQSSIAQRQDLEKQKAIDESVKELLARQRERKPASAPADDWTSPPMQLGLLGLQEEGPGSLSGRAGVSAVLENELYQALASRGIQVVERAVLDKLLAELKLGSSSLADPESQLKLGKILAARLLASGSLYESAQGARVALRLIDSESSALALSVSQAMTGDADPAAIAARLADAIEKAMRERYPLKGRIASLEGSTVLLNLGKKHGVRVGENFNVLGKREAVELNGKILGYRETPLGQLEVTAVEEGFAQAKAVDKTGVWEVNGRIIQSR